MWDSLKAYPNSGACPRIIPVLHDYHAAWCLLSLSEPAVLNCSFFSSQKHDKCKLLPAFPSSEVCFWKPMWQNQLNNTILDPDLMLLWIFIRAYDIFANHKQAKKNLWSCLVECFTTRIYEYFKLFVLSPEYEKANESSVLLVY